MTNKLNMKDIWEELKQTEDLKELETIEVAENMYNLIIKLIDARKAKGYSQRDLAKISGIKQSAIARLETMQVTPRIDTIYKLAFHLGVKLEAHCEIDIPKQQTIEIKVVNNNFDFGNQYYDKQESMNTYISNKDLNESECGKEIM